MGRTEGGRKFRPEKGMASMQDYFTDKGKTDILRSTRTGLWEIILCQGREPVMHADSVMLELLGLDAAPAPEECYQVWYNSQIRPPIAPALTPQRKLRRKIGTILKEREIQGPSDMGWVTRSRI